MPLALLINPKTWLLWLSVVHEAVKLARLLGAEKTRDSLRKQCRKYTKSKGGTPWPESKNQWKF